MPRRFPIFLSVALCLFICGCKHIRSTPAHTSTPAEITSPVADRVTFRDDQTVLVNGKPYFPIGLYYAFEEMDDPSGKGLDKLKAMGFNTLFTIDRDRASLDRIAARGLRVWYRPPGGLQSEHESLRKVVTAYRDHPAILFWEHGDEPVLNGSKLDQSRIGYQIVKELDPNHPVLCTQSPNYDRVADFKKWAEISDVGAFDIYPVPLLRWEAKYAGPGSSPYTLGVMGLMTRKWQDFGGGKPVITVLQGMSWDPLQYGREGYPSYEQGRFMAYDSVINGAKGLNYFGLVGHEPMPATTAPAGSPEAVKIKSDYDKTQELNDWFWSYYGDVIRELSVMSPVFTSRDAKWALSVKAVDPGMPIGDVEWRVKQAEDGEVVLLVNGSERLMKLEMTAKPLAGRTLHAWGEMRALRVGADGSWFDRVPPFGVRIYSVLPAPAGME